MISRNLCLAGMMGAGKTTVARELGRRLNRRVVDTDDEIERWTGSDVPRLFDDLGEEGFRALEHDVVAEIATLHDLVVALGGGAVLRDDNVDALRFSGVIVYLEAPVDVLVARLASETDRRPLLPDDPHELRARLQALFDARDHRYAAVSDLRVDASGSSNEVVDVILDWAMATGDVLTPSEHEQVMP